MIEESRAHPEGRTYRSLIVVAALAFTVLPFITTFNEFLTKMVESLHLVSFIQGLAAPFLVKVIVVTLRALGIPAAGNGSYLYLTGGLIPTRIYISWNCIGWQSFVLLAFTLVTGLQGPYTLRSRLMTLLLGLEGTFLINLVRILIPSLLAHYFGYLPAILFHDYLGTIITLIWLGGFWYISFGSLLVRLGSSRLESSSSPEGNSPPGKGEDGAGGPLESR